MIQELVASSCLDQTREQVRKYCDTTIAEQLRSFEEVFATETPAVRQSILFNTYRHLAPGFHEEPLCFASWNQWREQAGV